VVRHNDSTVRVVSSREYSNSNSTGGSTTTNIVS
jgi:hypothetical protein